MKSALTLLALLLAAGIIVLVPGLVAPYDPAFRFADAARAVLLCGALAGTAGWLILRVKPHGSFLLQLFLCGLLLRVFIGTTIFVFNLQNFLGGDAITYDFVGLSQWQAWMGESNARFVVDQFIGSGMQSGWGMVYMVAGVYGLIGRNMLAIQFINGVLGAATAPLIFLCAQE